MATERTGAEARLHYADGVSVRPANADDYEFALALYLESTKPLLAAIGRWDEERIHARFRQGFVLDDIRIISSSDDVIGWMQVSEKPDEVHLDQLHLIREARDQGIGTRLIQQLKERGKGCGKAVALNVIRGNRAQHLYERLGFDVVDGDEEKMRMLWREGP